MLVIHYTKVNAKPQIHMGCRCNVKIANAYNLMWCEGCYFNWGAGHKAGPDMMRQDASSPWTPDRIKQGHIYRGGGGG